MISIRDLAVTYADGTLAEVHALRGIDLDVAPGEFVTVVGSNGSGKSTLAGVLAGTVRPRRGRVGIDGRDVTGLPEHARARWVARVFDDPLAGTAPRLSIEDNLALAMTRDRRRRLRRAVTAERREVMRGRLAELGLGLEHRLDDPAGTLSAGQRQSLTLLMASFGSPRVLLLDEHLAALDPRTSAVVADLTVRIAGTTGAAVLMITHDLAVAARLGTRTLVMGGGRMVADLRRETGEVTSAQLSDLLRSEPAPVS